MNDFLHYAIEKSDVISFDVFDTLLVRACGKPQNVFLAIEKESNRIGFAKVRTNAERKAVRRAAGTHQVSLEEIYACIPKYADLKDRELMFERETAQVNQEVFEIWQEAGRLGKKRVICSDMYLSERFVGDLLNKIGVSGWDAIYVSSDRNATKASGKLFDILIGETNVAPSRILHIGDNALSDVQQANKKGIVAFQYCRNVDSGILKPFSRNVSWSQIVENGWREFGSNDYWERIGYVYGGVLGYAYALLSSENKAILEVASAQTRREYAAYLATLKITPNEPIALVDMTTGGLSGTCLVEMALDRKVTSFYLMCFRPPLNKLPKNIVPYFHAHGSSAVFAWMSEFLFTGPTPTVREVRANKPLYASPCIFDEFKISICKKIRSAIIASAKELSKHDVRIVRSELLDYLEQFHAAVTARDESEFSFAREANNLDQNNFASPFHKELRQIRPLFKLFGRNIVNFRTFVRGGGEIVYDLFKNCAHLNFA